MFKNILKNAFTLAEIMIVFTVIGILTAILIPTLLTNAPDQEKLKAKKAYNTITRAVQELLNNGVYSEFDGTLSSAPFIKGTTEEDAKARVQFFCNQLADHLNVTNVDCTVDSVSDHIIHTATSKCGSIGVADFAMDTDYQTSEPLCLDIADNPNKVFHYSLLLHVVDSSKDNFFTNNSVDGAIPSNRFNFKTNDGVLWALQLTNFAHNNIVTLNGVSVPGFHSLVCFNTANGAGLENTYCLAVRKDGKIIPDSHLQEILDEIEEDN